MRGVLILALNSKEYANYAYNLALSIKSKSDIPIHLIHDNCIEKIPENCLYIFDGMSKIDEKDKVIDKKFSPARAKLNIYSYSPFQETVYIDADSFVFDDLEPLFEACKRSKKSFLSENQGFATSSTKEFEAMKWGKVSDVFKHFELSENDKLPSLNSSFIYFKKNKKTEALFDLALSMLIENPFNTHTSPQRWGHAYNQPDELYLNTALAKTKTDPSMDFKPLFFPVKGQLFKYPDKLRKEGRFGYTFAGDGYNIDKKVVAVYNGDLLIAAKSMSLPNPVGIDRLLKRKFIRTN